MIGIKDCCIFQILLFSAEHEEKHAHECFNIVWWVGITWQNGNSMSTFIDQLSSSFLSPNKHHGHISRWSQSVIDKAYTFEMFKFSLVSVAVLFILTQSTEGKLFYDLKIIMELHVYYLSSLKLKTALDRFSSQKYDD
jgi:hypothetical protein